MLLILFRIIALLVLMIAPATGPQKRRKHLKQGLYHVDTDVSNANYAIDANGFLVRIHGRELSKYEL